MIKNGYLWKSSSFAVVIDPSVVEFSLWHEAPLILPFPVPCSFGLATSYREQTCACERYIAASISDYEINVPFFFVHISPF